MSRGMNANPAPAGTRTNYPVLLVILGVFAVLAIAYLSSGPLTRVDSERYLGGADTFLATGSISGKAANYKGYVLFVAGVKAVVDDPKRQNRVIIVLQALAAGVALLCLYSLGRMLFTERTGLVAAGLYAVNFYALRWIPHVSTESMFMAFVIIACWFCVKARREPWWWVPAIPITLFAAYIRPNGIAMLPVFLIFLLLSMKGHWRSAALVLVAAVAVFQYGAVTEELDRSASHEDLVSHLEKGTVIWGFEHMAMPNLSNHGGGQLQGVVRYAIAYPVQTATLVGKRLYAALSWQRTDYSPRHSLFLAVMVPLIYLLAVLGVYRQSRAGMPAEHLLPVFLILAQLAVIGVSFAHHDHRFMNAVMPLVFLFAAHGAVALVSRFSSRFSRTPPP